MKITDLGYTEQEFYALDSFDQGEIIRELYMKEEGVIEVDVFKFNTWEFMKEFEGGLF